MVTNIVVPFSKSRIENLTESEWDGVQELVTKPDVIMVYSYEDQAKALIAMGACLDGDGLGIMRMHIFHDCQSDPVMIQNFGEGYADGPCPVCKEDLYEDQVEYDLELILKYGIRLEK